MTLASASSGLSNRLRCAAGLGARRLQIRRPVAGRRAAQAGRRRERGRPLPISSLRSRRRAAPARRSWCSTAVSGPGNRKAVVARRNTCDRSRGRRAVDGAGGGAADTSMLFWEHARQDSRAAPSRIKAKSFDFLFCISHTPPSTLQPLQAFTHPSNHETRLSE